jgi:hypothetical protein
MMDSSLPVRRVFDVLDVRDAAQTVNHCERKIGPLEIRVRIRTTGTVTASAIALKYE